MRVCTSWLNHWVKKNDSIEQLAEQLTLAGLEVARIEAAGELADRENVTIGRIASCTSHPNAERLKVCQVDTGASKQLTIVCGAPNVRKNLLTACAKPGACLPKLQVESTNIRGVESEGMLCSAMELGLDNSDEGIIEFDDNAPIGRSVVDYLKLSEPVVEFELTPNRGDCLGMMGIAREVAVLNGVALDELNVKPSAVHIKDALTIELEAASGCPRYVGRALKNVDQCIKTPDWMIERLRRSGMRSINPVVDVTNYVMHELGQPMHAFDMEQIRGGIRVRMAFPKERLCLLDGKEVELDQNFLVIADHERAIALAGIMGGAETAITNNTNYIFLESAYFSPEIIRGKARMLGMQTDASHRFERGVDPEMQVSALDMATELIIEIAGGVAGPLTHAASENDLPQRKSIMLSSNDVERVLGYPINPNMSESILRNLGFKIEQAQAGWRATPPSWRFDIQSPYDLVEEIGRCYGYDAITPRVRTFLPETHDKRETDISVYDLKLNMMALGYHEAVTYSFVGPAIQDSLIPDSNASIMLKNPIAEDMSVMRKSLWPGLLAATSNNLKRQEKRVRLFEVGTVFLAEKGMQNKQEKQMLAAIACGPVKPRQWAASEAKIDFFDLKGDLMNALSLTGCSSHLTFEKSNHPIFQPGQGAQILIKDHLVGLLGKLHPIKAKQLDIDEDIYLFELDLQHFLQAKLPQFMEIPRFPPVHRDLALVVNESITVKSLEYEINASAGHLLKKITLFDVFRGTSLEDDTKSIAFGLTFQSDLGNLTAQEVDSMIKKIVDELGTSMNVKLRE